MAHIFVEKKLKNFPRAATRKHYIKPELKKYGTIKELTTIKSQGLSDGGGSKIKI